ncbi:MAG TPA: universal stress protein [Polyangiales bacterium]|nr:universal stress protein [Polyangiales bacterium]
MNQPPKHLILAAVSLDDTGELALREAARNALHHGSSELHIVHVVDYGSDEPSDNDPAGILTSLAAAEAKLRERVEALASPDALRVVGHIRAGVPFRAILQVAAEIDADLIVVGTHKRTGVRRFILGSVAERVLRDAHCPVLVAMVKDHPAAMQSAQIEPACEACLSIRVNTAGATYWCERHSRSRMRPHVYEPSDARAPVPMT